MKFSPLILTTALMALALVSCDKAQEIANQVKSKVQGTSLPKAPTKLPSFDSLPSLPSLGSTAAPKDSTDPALKALVDQNENGILFRKDLPFPTQLRIKATRTLAYSNTREISNSMVEKKTTRLEGTVNEDYSVTRNGDQFTLSLGNQTLSTVDPKDPTKSFAQPISNSKSGKTLTLTSAGTKWTAHKSADFTLHAWAQEITPQASALFTEAGAISRTLWFGKKRLKIGDSVPIPQAQLPLLFAFPGAGEVKLVLEGIEPIHGHPCGVFCLSGHYTAKNHVAPNGEKTDVEMTISSGKVWLSVLYPLVLKQQLETVQTVTGLHRHLQGGMSLTIDRDWKAE